MADITPNTWGPTGCYEPQAPPKPPPPKNSSDAVNEKLRQYQQQLSEITCPCGYGYFTEDSIWVPGDLVRSGEKPQRDGTFVEVPLQAGCS